jgi:hypothetical protein
MIALEPRSESIQKIKRLIIIATTLALLPTGLAHAVDEASSYEAALRQKARIALSYIDCDGDFTVRNGRLGINLDGRFVADTILGATYVGAIYVWGGDDKRYTLLFSDDLSIATFAATSGGSTQARCHPVPR